MAMAVCCARTQPTDALGLPSDAGQHQFAHQPINFLYGHLHNSIRTELENLSTWSRSLEAGNEQDLLHRLLHLKERYHFLEQVYKYHSSVEDEVVYPALDTKVKNVTSAYSVEHQDEEYLFEHLASLLASALSQTGTERAATIRKLICKIEEIHITLRKHLAKEEAQLLPLLLQHFSHAEQAELVAQFLYCIPLDTVERVLSWLKPMVPLEELQELMQHLRDVIPDRLLLQLLVTWLNPLPATGSTLAAARPDAAAAAGSGTSAAAVAVGSAAAVAAAAAAAGDAAAKLVICPFAAAASKQPAMALANASSGSVQATDASDTSAAAAAAAQAAAQQWPPLRGIVLFHHSIRGALEVFAAEAAALQQQSGVTAGQLAGLVERHRFLRSVCMFHTLSEEEVMFPEVLRISGLGPSHHLASVTAACTTCQQEHSSEVLLFEELGRLLADVRAFVRRGRTRDVTGMLGKLVSTAQRVCSAISTHMQREEAEVLPLLAASLGPEQQRGMVWHTLRAMPLRLLERVLPWLLSRLSPEDAEGMMTNLRLGAPQVDQQLVELLLRWAQRGRWPLPEPVVAGIGATGIVGVAAALAVTAAPGQDVRVAPAGPDDEVPVSTAQQQQLKASSGPLAASKAAAEVAGCQQGVAAEQALPVQVHDSLKGIVPAAVIEALCRSCGTSATIEPHGSGSSPSSTSMQQQQLLLDVGSSPTAAAAASQQQQQWNMHDPCYFSNNTCELRLIRQASDSCNSPRKRQRLCENSSSNDSSSADATPTAAQAASASAAAAAAVGASMAGDVVGAAAALACAVTIQGLIMEQQDGMQQQQQQLKAASPDAAAAQPGGSAAATGLGSDSGAVVTCADAALHGVAAGAVVGSAAAGCGTLVAVGVAAGTSSKSIGSGGCSASNPTGCNPIDHIFQFHKALRRELKQLEADAAALEHAVLTSCKQLGHQQQQLEQQQPDSLPAPLPQQQQQAGSLTAPLQQQRQAPGDSAAAGVPGDSGGGSSSSSSITGTASAASAAALLRECSRSLQQLDGRFQFLWGIYRAHSKAEDEIVFPALESKEALHNVSHAYTLDHEQEEQLFHDLAAVIARLKASASAAEARELALQLRRMCAAVRASLETHVRAEEAELWPLFSEHFSIREQQHLVGVIIGRTGAEVLQALLPWVTGSFSEEEKEAMMGSLREATKNTMFDQWLGAVQQSSGTAAAPPMAGTTAGTGGTPAEQQQQQQTLQGIAATSSGVAVQGAAVEQQPQYQQQMDELAEIAEYLAGGSSSSSGSMSGLLPTQQQQQQEQCQTEVSGTVAESTNYVPGWEDIFNINQKQLEAAIRRVSNDPNLEPQRKAYLIQNIMVSRYIVAQQRRMQTTAAGAAAGAALLQQQQQLAGQADAGGAMLPPPPVPVQQQQHKNADGLCCHHQLGPERVQQAQQQLQQQQVQQQAPQQQQIHVQQLCRGGSAGVQAQSPRKTFADAAAGVLGCKHYRRSAQLVSPCCGKVYTCRLCHDEDSDHRLDRYAVSEMLCMLCGTRQPVAGTCSACSARLAGYYCSICHLFDDEPGRDIYHCPFCNVCRRGKGLGVDFFHCMQCNACMSLSLFNSHTCRERAMEGNCPVCHEYLFDSSTPIKELPCGHFLHSSCFAEYARYSYTCPICCKSIGDMSVYFQMLDSLLASERCKLPAEYAGRSQSVLCQDCGKAGQAPYHFVYHKCPSCQSYNTRVL